MASSWGSSWLGAWGNSWGVIDRDTHDGGSEEDYRRYRKYLERLTKAVERKKISPKVIEAVQEIELPVETPEIKKLTIPESVIDFSALEREIEKLNAFINQFLIQQEQMREQDDEFALLLLVT